ncbi:MAG: gamma carbonic anhydrase family protein [Myxococcales bacterium]|nr:gamma carbonic anhydrase family protein [Myxococcales bacterium]
MALILPHHGVSPKIAIDAFVAPNATIIGDVEIGGEASVWFQTVVRGDVYPIRIGPRSNIQDLSMVHVRTNKYATILEEDVTVGHSVTLHGCILRARCLIGIGAIVLDGVEVGEDTIIAAGSVITPGTIIPPRVLAVGAPCKVKRDLTEQEVVSLKASAENYVLLAKTYRNA